MSIPCLIFQSGTLALTSRQTIQNWDRTTFYEQPAAIFVRVRVLLSQELLTRQIVGNVNYFYNQHLSTWVRERLVANKENYKDTDPYFITAHPHILTSMVECHTITLSIWKVYWYVQWIQGNVKWSAIKNLPVHNLDNEYDTCHFFPDFLIPPPTRGPFCAAFALASWRAFCCSFIFCLWATSSSAISWSFFLGAFSGFFLPPSRPVMVLQHGQIAIIYPKHHNLQQ